MLPVDCQKSPQGQNTPKCHGDVAISMLIPSVFPCCFLVHSAQHISVTGQTQREHAKSLAAGPREVELSSKAHLWGSTGRDGWSFKGDPEMGMGPNSGDLRQKRWWFNMIYHGFTTKKGGGYPQINPNYGKLMDHGKYHGVPNLEAAAAAPHVHRTIGSCQDKEKEGDWRGKGTMWILVDRFRQSLKMFEAIIISKKSPKSIRGGSTALAPAMVGGGGWRGLTRHDRWWQLGQWRMDHDDIMMQIETMGDRMS